MRNTTIFLVVFILLALVFTSTNSIAVARDPQYSSSGLNIVPFQIDFVPLESSASLGWHVYNSTNHRVSNAATSCNVYIVNGLGTPIAISSEYAGIEKGWYANLTSTNITKNAGVYGYGISCNNSQAGFFAGQLEVSATSGRQADMPISLSITLLGVFLFSMFFAGYFAIQKHPLVYLFTILAFLLADVMVWLNWRVLSFNGSPMASVFFGLYLGLLSITFLIGIVTMLDVTRMVMQSMEKKKAAKNIARFGNV